MSKKIAILRGINVGGKRKIRMADLKNMLEKLNFSNITTYIQSGNVIFNTDEVDTKILGNQIKTAIQETFGYDVPVIIRTAEALRRAVAQNPFYEQDMDSARLHLTFLSDTPSQENLEKIAAYNYEPDKFAIIGNNAFVYCEGKYHQSKLTNNFFEKKLKVRATTRNWKTTLKLLALSADEKV